MSKQQIIEKKKRALNYFTRRILSGPIKKDIDKVILFGSLVYGKPHEESDIDLLLISKISRKRNRFIDDKLADASFDTLLKYGEMIEPLLYNLEDYKKPKSSFLAEAIQYGQEIYSS